MSASLEKTSAVSASARQTFWRTFSWVLLGLLLLLLAFRVSTVESLRETVAQKQARLGGNSLSAQAPDIGPAFTSVYVASSLLLAGAATFAAGRVRGLSWRRLGQFLLVAGVLALAVGSTFHAADRFAALVGAADLGVSLCGAWTILVVCDETLLGDQARRVVAAAVLGLCAIAVAKSLMQYFVEFPDTAQFVKEHRDDVFRAQGIENDPVGQDLFLHRIASNELSGFSLDSDVLATELIPAGALLVLLIGVGIWWLRLQKSIATAPRGKRSSGGQTQIPPELLGVIWLCVLAGALLFVLRFTDSKGGIACGLLAIVAVGIGLAAKGWIARHRRALLIGAAAVAVLGTAGVILYGRAHDALPTKSLLYRWHYWTATVPIIRESPALGVGLNNFGDYYEQFKRPASPEDVKDPHNFFIRLAAEAGIPAACLVGLLIVTFLMGAFRGDGARPGVSGAEGDTARAGASAGEGSLALFAISFLPAAAWAILHCLLAEPVNMYTTMITCIYAVFAWWVFMAAWFLLKLRHPATGALLISSRMLAVVLAVAALAMLLYDQINIALVTGPVAMLFWMILAAGDVSFVTGPGASRERGPWVRRVAAFTIAAMLVAASVAGLIQFTLPACAGTFRWDPAPYETAFLRAANKGDWPAAATALDAALARAPRSIELRLQRIAVVRRMGLPVAPDIRSVFALDRANASLRVMLALPDTDLPADERVAALEDALHFDAALDPAEAKRLTPEKLAAIKSKIQQLDASARQSP